MKLRAFALFVAAMLLFGMTACEDIDETSVPEEDGNTTPGMSIQVEESTGEMSIERPQIENPAPMGQDDTWTIFVYLCGSDLESRFFFGGAASDDIEEMCKATEADNVSFVIETGGCDYWHNDMIDSDSLGRFVIEHGSLTEVGTADNASMGKSSTLADFLCWGVEKYPAENMGVILWDHGGGSITGVCFDESSDDDSLSLREIDAGLLSTMKNANMTDTFEFVGFDACLMATVETANVLASYADYMIASEESEPGTGWDYTAIGNYLAKHPDADGAAVGEVICDSFKKQCEDSGSGQIATLSVTDLSRIDDLMKDFNSFAREMYINSEDKDALNQMIRNIREVDNFGGNSRAEGYTNMVDLGGLISSCSDWSDSAKAAQDTLQEAVVYKVAGSDHENASGLSMYYPLSIEDSKEMNVFESVCISPYYLSFVGRQGYGSIHDGSTDGYEDEEIFEGGFWGWLDEFLFDEDTGDYDYDYASEEGSFWDFFDEHEDDQSDLITFEEEPGTNDYGQYSFQLDDSGCDYTSEIIALVYQEMDDGTFIELGETYDVNVDWDTGYASDNFDGYWLSLPDGQNLALYITGFTDEYTIYVSPILLNGEPTYLRMRQYYGNESVQVEGAWNGIDENGAADRNIIKLQKGDVIIPTYFCLDEEGNELEEYEGDPYTMTGKKLKIDYDYMYVGDYAYAFCVTDIYGDDYISDMAEFNIDEDGEITFYQ